MSGALVLETGWVEWDALDAVAVKLPLAPAHEPHTLPPASHGGTCELQGDTPLALVWTTHANALDIVCTHNPNSPHHGQSSLRVQLPTHAHPIASARKWDTPTTGATHTVSLFVVCVDGAVLRVVVSVLVLGGEASDPSLRVEQPAMCRVPALSFGALGGARRVLVCAVDEHTVVAASHRHNVHQATFEGEDEPRHHVVASNKSALGKLLESISARQEDEAWMDVVGMAMAGDGVLVTLHANGLLSVWSVRRGHRAHLVGEVQLTDPNAPLPTIPSLPPCLNTVACVSPNSTEEFTLVAAVPHHAAGSFAHSAVTLRLQLLGRKGVLVQCLSRRKLPSGALSLFSLTGECITALLSNPKEPHDSIFSLPLAVLLAAPQAEEQQRGPDASVVALPVAQAAWWDEVALATDAVDWERDDERLGGCEWRHMFSHRTLTHAVEQLRLQPRGTLHALTLPQVLRSVVMAAHHAEGEGRDDDARTVVRKFLAECTAIHNARASVAGFGVVTHPGTLRRCVVVVRAGMAGVCREAAPVEAASICASKTISTFHSRLSQELQRSLRSLKVRLPEGRPATCVEVQCALLGGDAADADRPIAVADMQHASSQLEGVVDELDASVATAAGLNCTSQPLLTAAAFVRLWLGEPLLAAFDRRMSEIGDPLCVAVPFVSWLRYGEADDSIGLPKIDPRVHQLWGVHFERVCAAIGDAVDAVDEFESWFHPPHRPSPEAHASVHVARTEEETTRSLARAHYGVLRDVFLCVLLQCATHPHPRLKQHCVDHLAFALRRCFAVRWLCYQPSFRLWDDDNKALAITDLSDTPDTDVITALCASETIRRRVREQGTDGRVFECLYWDALEGACVANHHDGNPLCLMLVCSALSHARFQPLLVRLLELCDVRTACSLFHLATSALRTNPPTACAHFIQCAAAVPLSFSTAATRRADLVLAELGQSAIQDDGDGDGDGGDEEGGQAAAVVQGARIACRMAFSDLVAHTGLPAFLEGHSKGSAMDEGDEGELCASDVALRAVRVLHADVTERLPNFHSVHKVYLEAMDQLSRVSRSDLVVEMGRALAARYMPRQGGPSPAASSWLVVLQNACQESVVWRVVFHHLLALGQFNEISDEVISNGEEGGGDCVAMVVDALLQRPDIVFSNFRFNNAVASRIEDRMKTKVHACESVLGDGARLYHVLHTFHMSQHNPRKAAEAMYDLAFRIGAEREAAELEPSKCLAAYHHEHRALVVALGCLREVRPRAGAWVLHRVQGDGPGKLVHAEELEALCRRTRTLLDTFTTLGPDSLSLSPAQHCEQLVAMGCYHEACEFSRVFELPVTDTIASIVAHCVAFVGRAHPCSGAALNALHAALHESDPDDIDKANRVAAVEAWITAAADVEVPQWLIQSAAHGRRNCCRVCGVDPFLSTAQAVDFVGLLCAPDVADAMCEVQVVRRGRVWVCFEDEAACEAFCRSAPECLADGVWAEDELQTVLCALGLQDGDGDTLKARQREVRVEPCRGDANSTVATLTNCVLDIVAGKHWSAGAVQRCTHVLGLAAGILKELAAQDEERGCGTPYLAPQTLGRLLWAMQRTLEDSGVSGKQADAMRAQAAWAENCVGRFVRHQTGVDAAMRVGESDKLPWGSGVFPIV